jgi:hypothetical protein
MKPENSGFKNE